MVVRSMRPPARLPSGVVAIGAQMWQAATSFALQILASWMLGASGLALVSLCYGIIIVATAVNGGIVGDSLTVLARRDSTINGGLNGWLLTVALIGGVGGASCLYVAGVLDAAAAIAFAGAAAAFMVEDTLRRVHIARLQFWRLFLIDGAALAGTLVTIAVAGRIDQMSVLVFLAALGVGQVIGGAVAWLLLPRSDRLLGVPRARGMRIVGAFGLWRGAQVALTPTIQTAARVVILHAAGAAALGHIEAGRIYVAPAVLTVQGFGSYLFARYALSTDEPTSRLIALAHKSALYLAGLALALGALALLLLPLLGPLVSGPTFLIDPVVVLGWSCAAASTAGLQPFASLAAARGHQRRVFGLRTVDAVLAPAALWAALALLAMPPAYSPYILAGGLVLAGWLVRRFALAPLVALERAGQTDGSP